MGEMSRPSTSGSSTSGISSGISSAMTLAEGMLDLRSRVKRSCSTAGWACTIGRTRLVSPVIVRKRGEWPL